MPDFEILLSRELAALGMDRQLRNWHARGAVTHVAPGAYVKTSEFAALTTDERYRLRIAAIALLFPGTQFSHDSAAALWRLPTLGSWPEGVHASGRREAGGRSNANLVRHGLGLDPHPAVIDSVTVTSLARTLADVAGHRSFARAVTMLDDGLRAHEESEFRHGAEPPTKGDVLRELERLGRFPGHARARNAVSFADARSGSPGESLSRVQMLALSLPAPELQVPFYDSTGLIGFADYYWRELGLVGEFDGNSKYGDARRHARGLSPAEVLLAEKAREDRLRQVVRGVVRWGWSTARDRRALERLLAPHGVVPSRSARRR
jgi:hypothetical protein